MNSLIELKQVIDSMKSFVEKDDIDNFQQQLSIIEGQYTDKTAVISVIKMMQSMGRYLGSRKENAHEDTIPMLDSIFSELEKLVSNPDFTTEQSNHILSGCIQNYKSLKNKIASQPLVTATEIQELKAVILAVDWEISDQTLKTFDEVTRRLLLRLKSHKILHSFVRIIHSMGRYIASKKANAHKDSISFLRSVFENFEKIIQTPEMQFPEKKKLIESDINAFHNFKREIASAGKNIPDHADKTEDENIQPALSHVKISPKTAEQDVVPLHPLSQEKPAMTGPLDSKILTPALTGRGKGLPAPRDVMDELFSMKESPADELLDAIHLEGIHGPDQQETMNRDKSAKELQKEGIKNFIPRRKDNEPIPEIGNRLDEFFSLDISETDDAAMGNKIHHALVPEEKDDLPASDDNSTDAIVPFQYEDESFEENLDNEDPVKEARDRLQSLVKTHEGSLADNSLKIMDNDLFHLKTHWQDDPDKTMLIDIAAWLLGIINDQPEPVSRDARGLDDRDTKPVSVPPTSEKSKSEQSKSEKPTSEKLESPPLVNSPAPGFWGKLKSKLFS